MAAKRVLIVLSEWGYWGEELIGPLETFDIAGYESTFVTPTGLRPLAYPVSMDPTFVDPPLGKIVVSQEMADKVKKIEDPHNQRLSAPLNLAQWFPENPYPSAPDYIRRRERYFVYCLLRSRCFVIRYFKCRSQSQLTAQQDLTSATLESSRWNPRIAMRAWGYFAPRQGVSA